MNQPLYTLDSYLRQDGSTTAKIPTTLCAVSVSPPWKNISVSDLQSQVQGQCHKPQLGTHQRAELTINKDSGSISESDVDTDQSRDFGRDLKSDDEADYLNGLIGKFEEEGPQMSNLGDIHNKLSPLYNQARRHSIRKHPASTIARLLHAVADCC